MTLTEARALAVHDRVKVAIRGRHVESGETRVDWVPGVVAHVVHVPELRVRVNLERQPWVGRRVPGFRVQIGEPADLERR